MQVNAEGDAEKSIYSADNAELELPYLCPGADESGFTRLERLEMAAEYDIWQVGYSLCNPVHNMFVNLCMLCVCVHMRGCVAGAGAA